MKAAVLKMVGQALVLEDRPTPEPGPGQVLVALEAAALNRRDYWITLGKYPGVHCPVVLGSDGAGVVRDVGGQVDRAWLGRQVIINPGLDWGDDPRVQSGGFHILGMPSDGTLAEAVLVPVGQLCDRPQHLTWAEAAALPLAGLTAYRAAIVQGAAAEGQRVLVTGAGGGVATLAVQFARAAGAQVFVTSSSPAKIDAAVQLGAAAGYNYRDEDWRARLGAEHGLMDLIIDGAGGAGYEQLINLAAPGGTIVNYGSTAGAPPGLDLFKVFWKQLRIQGSTMGSPDDFAAMVQMVERHRLRPPIDATLPLAAVNDALDRMRRSSQFGKIVIQPCGS